MSDSRSRFDLPVMVYDSHYDDVPRDPSGHVRIKARYDLSFSNPVDESLPRQSPRVDEAQFRLVYRREDLIVERIDARKRSLPFAPLLAKHAR